MSLILNDLELRSLSAILESSLRFLDSFAMITFFNWFACAIRMLAEIAVFVLAEVEVSEGPDSLCRSNLVGLVRNDRSPSVKSA